jgi:hypothetical protein
MSNARSAVSLAEELKQIAPGEQSSDVSKRILVALALVWHRFKGSHETGMMSDKLPRAEKVTWSPPVLSFTIERHGAFTLGSSRAELYRWEVDVDKNTATYVLCGFRQLAPPAPRLSVEPIAKSVCEAVQAGPHGDPKAFLVWRSVDEVLVKQSLFIPDNGPMQTVSGRRRRFREALIEQMREIGWTYEPTGRWIKFRRGVR